MRLRMTSNDRARELTLMACAIGRTILDAENALDETRRHGLAMGLPELDVLDTIKVWLNYYTRWDGVDWPRIRAQLTARARGLEWRPPQ